ncbi:MULTISPECIES: hypothetical protein [unclassified Variovorax]|jgi:hypothetical protein|uniref:hypothetical protein n=1 Tax=unclassified Variovorax TaxID=663243 RepID=UPI000F7F3AF1|nr:MULTISPECIES: hypothetical protein [unclassified Variovorax]RSZ45789.1 hypothetical protein EJO70_04845 [Variovorax sp. 553]RSZ46757.1 hypothetical protein EJO71_06465 [Variovorax sp. 679]
MASNASQSLPSAFAEPVPETAIPALVAQVYESAPVADRCHLVETLLRPLGVLSLVAIANGIFAKIRFQNAGHDLSVRIEDLQNVRGADMAALVHHAQQVSVETVDSLAQLLGSSGALAGSAAAALLIGLLVRRARARNAAQAQQQQQLIDDASLDPL